MKLIFISLSLIFLNISIAYSSEISVLKTFYGEVFNNNENEYKIQKRLSHDFGELIIEINFNNLEIVNDSLKLFFNTKFVSNKINNFNVFYFTEELNGEILLQPIKICLNCDGIFNITIPRTQLEIKLVVKDCEYGMSFAIFKIE